MSRYIDLHLHLLPGVDDGPADLETSLDHARRLVRDGVFEATVTPHVRHPAFPVDVASLPERVEELQAALQRAGLPLQLHVGGEIHPSGATTLSPVELETIAHGPAGARWVLLEAPFAGIDDAFVRACEHVRAEGFGIVIAHPERAAALVGNGLALLRAQLAAGAVAQVNVCSLLGRHGPQIERAARQLVRSRLAYILASDGHAGLRSHTLADGYRVVREAGASEVQAWQLTRANPLFLLRHGIPPRPVGEDYGRSILTQGWMY